MKVPSWESEGAHLRETQVCGVPALVPAENGQRTEVCLLLRGWKITGLGATVKGRPYCHVGDKFLTPLKCHVLT